MTALSERISEPILVTGATGFIGRRLVTRLIEEGYRPRALVLPGESLPEGFDGVDVVRGDVTLRPSVAPAVDGAATVFHLAAKVGDWGTADEHQRVTVRGTDNVLREATRNDARVLLASSVVVYGGAIGKRVCEEHRPRGRPLGPYSRSKMAQEEIAERLEADESLRVTIIRPTNVYGAGSVPWVDLPVAELKKERPVLIAGGRMAAGLTHVDNVVDVFVRAAQTQAAVGRTYNASDDNGITWLRYFTELAEMVGAPPPKSIPRPIAHAAATALDAGWKLLRRKDRPLITREALNLVGSHFRVPIGRARRELGYEPPVSYHEGMRQVAGYLKEKHA